MNEASIYHIHPVECGYVTEWYVMAYNTHQALVCLKNYLSTRADNEANGPYANNIKFDRDLFERWKDATTFNLPEGYVVDVHPELEIIEREC